MFSEAVTDFDDAGDVAITGGALTGGASGITATGTNGTDYTVSVTPSGAADVTVQVPAGAATDGVNGNLASETDTIDYVDSTAPTVVSIERHDGADAPTNADTLVWTVTFSEPVTVGAGAFALDPALNRRDGDRHRRDGHRHRFDRHRHPVRPALPPP